MSARPSPTLLAVVFAAAALLGSTGATASNESAHDPTIFSRYSLSEWRLSSATSRVVLPRAPVIGWKVRVAGGIAHAPTVTADGEVLIALSTPQLADYDARGHLKWSARLGATPAALSPLARDDGSRLVFTEGAEAQVYSRLGRLLIKRTLPFGTLDDSAVIAALPDGGLLLGSGRRLARLDASLGVVFQSRIDSEIKGVFGGAPPLVVGVNGAVYELRSDGSVTRRGTFAGRVDAVARLADQRLLAVLDARRLSELDLAQDASFTRLAEADLLLYPRLAGNALGEARAVGSGEILFAFSADGRERYRAALPSASGTQRPTQAELLLGPDGSALVALSGSDLLAIAPDGSVSRALGSACAEPLRPAGLDGSSAVFACRSGIVVMLRDGAPTSAAKPR